MRRVLTMPLSRRAVLGVAAVLAAGCRPGAGATASSPRPTASADPRDTAALDAARAGELRLLGEYDAALRNASRRQRGPLRAARAVHESHARALGATGPPARVRTPGSLRAAERSSAGRLRAAAVEVHAGTTAALLASIAASHEAGS